MTDMIRQRFSRARDDAGVMLIIALLIITTVALVTGAVLSHGFTNFRATVTLQGVAGTSYAADAAANVAINNLRLGRNATTPTWTPPSFPGPGPGIGSAKWDVWTYVNGADGTGCFGVTAADGDGINNDPDNVLELHDLYPAAGDQTSATSARVECTPVAGTGIFGAGSGVVIEDPDPTDAFARALTTVGTVAANGTFNGMTLKPLGDGNNGPMPMRGGVASKSFIDVDNGALVTDGVVWANGTCTAARIVSADTVCNTPGKVVTPNTPPSPIASVPAFRNAADYRADALNVAKRCNFVDGFYNDAAALTSAVESCTVARFAPGKYYFDFNDEGNGTGQNVWKINKTVIGGAGGSSATIPGRCLSPITNDPVDGVQFVFGGTSRISVGDNSHVELCGPSNGGEAPMTLYQQQAGTAPASTTIANVSAAVATPKTGGKFVTPTTTPLATPPTPAVTPVDAISAADAKALDWTILSNGTNELGVDLRNFSGLSAIPAGADIVSAVVRVKYTKSSSQELRVSVEGQAPANIPVTAADPAGLPDWRSADVAAALRTQLQGGSFSDTKPTLQLRLLGGAKDDKLSIDAVKLSVTWRPAALRPATDVMFIDAPGGNYKGEFVVQGATFAPNGYVRLVPGSDDDALVAFRWGLVALGVEFKAQPSQEFGYPLVSIPSAGTGLGGRVTVVDLEVYVCVEAGTCPVTADDEPALTVRVMITDPPYTEWTAGFIGPRPGVRKMTILSWAEQN